MAHPYNQSQHVYINITGERGAGTDIQPNLFYGYDIPATDFIYSGGNYPVQPDWAYSDFEYPSGSFFPALTEYYPFDARNPTGIFVGAKLDIATLETSWTGRDYGLYLDYPSNDHRITGLFTGLLKETADVGV